MSISSLNNETTNQWLLQKKVKKKANKGAIQEAKEILKNITNKDAKNWAILEIVIALIKKNNIKNAEQLAETISISSTPRSWAYLNLSEAFYEIGDIEKLKETGKKITFDEIKNILIEKLSSKNSLPLIKTCQNNLIERFYFTKTIEIALKYCDEEGKELVYNKILKKIKSYIKNYFKLTKIEASSKDDGDLYKKISEKTQLIFIDKEKLFKNINKDKKFEYFEMVINTIKLINKHKNSIMKKISNKIPKTLKNKKTAFFFEKVFRKIENFNKDEEEIFINITNQIKKKLISLDINDHKKTFEYIKKATHLANILPNESIKKKIILILSGIKQNIAKHDSTKESTTNKPNQKINTKKTTLNPSLLFVSISLSTLFATLIFSSLLILVRKNNILKNVEFLNPPFFRHYNL